VPRVTETDAKTKQFVKATEKSFNAPGGSAKVTDMTEQH
jgi:hypothetical protein